MEENYRPYLEDKEAVLSRTESDASGLSSAEAQARLEQYGPNKLIEAKKRSAILRFFDQMKDPMIIILLVAAALSFFTSIYQHENPADVFIILFVVVLNSVLGVIQESKAEEAIEALKKMTAAKTKVLRDGVITTVESDMLVPGDVIVLEAGDSIPADGRIIEEASMKVEEAALTGESVPVTKQSDAIELGKDAKDVPLGDRKNMVYMGSTVVYGRGKAVLTGTGMSTEMGKIADAIAQAEEELTPLQIKLAQLSKILTKLVIGICIFIFALGVIKAGHLSMDVMIDTFMLAISLAVAAIPEGLVAVVTIVLSIGVTKMSQRNAVIRRLTAVETLGCAQIICSDKTGTLTQNKMTVVDYYSQDQDVLAAGMALCSDAELKVTEFGEEVVGEPTEAMPRPGIPVERRRQRDAVRLQHGHRDLCEVVVEDACAPRDLSAGVTVPAPADLQLRCVESDDLDSTGFGRRLEGVGHSLCRAFTRTAGDDDDFLHVCISFWSSFMYNESAHML